MLWDKGTWTPEQDDVDAALKKGDLKFTLDGYKLKGSWVLVKTSGRYAGVARRRRPQLAADQAQGRLGGRRRHRRVRAAQRQERRRLRGHPRRGQPGDLAHQPPGQGRRHRRGLRENHRARGARSRPHVRRRRPRTKTETKRRPGTRRPPSRAKPQKRNDSCELRALSVPSRYDRPPRLASVAALALLQDVPTTREVDVTVHEGTSMAAAASPDRRSIAIDLLGGIWILPVRGGDAHRITPELLEARQPDLVSRRPIDRVPGLRRWRVAHLCDCARRRRGEGDHQRRVRRSRARLVARRIAHRVLLRSLRRHHDHLGGRRSPPAAVAAGQQARRLDAVLVTGRSGGRRSSRSRTPMARERDRRARL